MALTINNLASTGVIAYNGVGRRWIANNNIDFSVAANNLVNAATMGVLIVPAKTLIEEVYMVVNTVNAGVTDVDIGVFSLAEVSVSGDGFVDGATIEAAGLIRDLAGETYSKQDGTFGYYSSAGCIIVLTNNDATSITLADIDFFAECVDLS